MKRLATLVLLGGLLAIHPGSAQDVASRPSTKPTAAAKVRSVYLVSNADPETVAGLLAAIYQGEAVVAAAPAGVGKAVIVGGSATAVADVGKLIEQLDRKPRAVEIEVTLVEATVAKDGKDPTAADLLKDGKGQRIKLTAVEGQSAVSTTGGSRPFVTGSVRQPVGPGGAGGRDGAGGFPGAAAQPRIVRGVNYQSVGTTVKLTARVESGDAVAVDLSVQETKVRPADDENGEPAIDNATLTTKVSVPAGKPVVAQTVRTGGKAGATVAMVIVTARVVGEGPTAAGMH
ncbi:hypothetical protein [Limnoglobus roseus]|uniref:NolW-like domain-containing protein n=1 Tax=Limnoglobus roseus TaxID=2598579 RepID=A0A5C1A8F3_9BACT|nr:hypothetical protein [Limnoglobus roseus]QEL15501.1 hypothetical protein PX52LOC_02424 [Limnoglobus roseus]